MSAISESYIKIFGVTPEPIKGSFDYSAYDVVILPNKDNTGTLFFGSNTRCEFPIPEGGMSLGDVHRSSGEEVWDLDRNQIRSSVDGESATILLIGVS